MKKLAFFVLIVIVLLSGCAPASIEPPSSTPAPPASEYPADISGLVTIAETVNAKYQSGSNAGETMEMTPLEGQIYWIIDILVKNKSYENAVTATGWKIVADSKVYDAQRPFMGIQSAYSMTVPVGGIGETTIRFPVPGTLKVSDTQLCYQGQEPYSYGKLTGGDRVAVYDWDLKKGVPEVTKQPSEVTEEPVIEQYYIFEPLGTRYVNLRTVGFWEGEGDKLIEFSLDKSPAVLNFAYTPTSTISSTFDYGLQGSGYAKLGSKYWSSTIGLEKKSGNTYHRHEVVAGTGEFKLKITSSGAHWYVRLGVE